MLKVDYITNSIFNSRTYVLSDGSDKVWLVDCGDIDPILSLVGGRRVESVLLTHAHFDHTGHNPSCLCFANSEVIFTGDAYIPGCKVVTNLPHCDKAQAEASIERILRLAEGKAVMPGHEGIYRR